MDNIMMTVAEGLAKMPTDHELPDGHREQAMELLQEMATVPPNDAAARQFFDKWSKDEALLMYLNKHGYIGWTPFGFTFIRE